MLSLLSQILLLIDNRISPFVDILKLIFLVRDNPCDLVLAIAPIKEESLLFLIKNALHPLF